MRTPTGLAVKGRALWRQLVDVVPGPAELVLLEEACRIADRLDKLDAVLRGDVDTWLRISDAEVPRVVVDSALSEARQQANVLKQIVAALRIPDEKTGKRPAPHPPRGVHQPKRAAVTSLDRARARSAGA